jgi:hypothetical protein
MHAAVQALRKSPIRPPFRWKMYRDSAVSPVTVVYVRVLPSAVDDLGELAHQGQHARLAVLRVLRAAA